MKRQLKIKDICQNASSSLKQKDVEGKNGTYPVYGASGLISKIDTFHQDKEYIAIVKDGSGIGRVSFMPAKSSIIGTMQYILPRTGFDIKYIGYCLKSLNLAEYKQGAAIPHIYFKEYGERLVNVTDSIPEQQAIVARLDSAFAKIDVLKANAQKQLENAKALFQNALKDAMTPKEGWEEKKLGEVCGKIGSGATPLGGKNVYIESGCSLIRSMNVQYNEFKYEELAHISDSASEQLKNVEIKENDVLFNITGASIARCCIVPKNILPARVNQHVSILRIVNSVLPKFLCFTLNSEPHQKELIGIGEAGSTRQALTKGDLSKHLIKYPSITEQQAIVSRLDEISSRCRQLEENYTKTIALCDDMKQALLRETFE